MSELQEQRFQLDLRGLVELLSKNLYTGPQVYVREVIQNGVDAITARRAHQPGCPAEIRLASWPDGAGVTITDTGIGLSAAQAEEFLATIGHTSKRDDFFDEGRPEYLGQFGIGLLACFLIADEVEVVSQSIDETELPVRWIGKSDGTFTVSTLDRIDAATGEPIAVGTQIHLRARIDTQHWVSSDTLVALASEYGSLLPIDIAVQVALGDDSGELVWRRVSMPQLPWEQDYSSPHARKQALIQYAQAHLGFTPLDVIDLEVGITGTSGVAFVLPQAVSPNSGSHRVYVKNMLVNAREDSLLPNWAFFVRAVINSESLTPTASREQLRDDEFLLITRQGIEQQLKDWISQLVDVGGTVMKQFISRHHLALRAVALESDDMLGVVCNALPFETSMGLATLAEVAENNGKVLYAPTTESYQRVAGVAAAQGVQIVNAGYVYDADLLARLSQRSDWDVDMLQEEQFTQRLSAVPLERELDLEQALSQARNVLQAASCDVLIRQFEPSSTPAIVLLNEQALAGEEFRQARDEASGSWAELMGSFEMKPRGVIRTLVFNDSNDTCRNFLEAFSQKRLPQSIFEAGVHTLYLCARMLAGEGLDASENLELSESLGMILDSACADKDSNNRR